MRLRWNRCSRSALISAMEGALGLPGCGAPSEGPTSTRSSDDADDDGSSTATSTSGHTSATAGTVDTADTEAPVGWLEVGWGQGEYVPLADGDDFPIVLGGQGAQMFPMPLRGAEWYLPENPTSWMDETGPLVDMEMDIEGWNDGPGGHFKRIANYTLDWEIAADGTYQSSFLPIIVPDGVEPTDIEGEPAHLWVRIRPYEQPALELELDVVVTIGDEPPPG